MITCTWDMRITALSVLMAPRPAISFSKNQTHQAHFNPSLTAISLRYRLDDMLKLHHRPGLELNFRLMPELIGLSEISLGSLGVLE